METKANCRIQLKQHFNSNRLRMILALFLIAGFTLLNLFLTAGRQSLEVKGIYAGSFLLAGLPLNTAAWAMPIYQILGAAAQNLCVEPALVFVILHLCVYALVLCAGGLLGGYYAGLLSLAASGLLEAGGGSFYNAEQSLYSFFLLLLLSLILLERRESTLKTALLCGLAAGASLLVRTPLFLFPPVFVFCGWLSGRDRSGAFVRRSLVFLAASYVLLIPWGMLNRSVSGEFSLFDGRRAASNIITAAKGSVYTMEGDSRRLAGLGEEDSAFKYYISETAKTPVFHAWAALRRLWHIFLFYPFLSGFLLLAMAASREKDKTLIFSLPVYFVLIHSALSVEKRYFYPLLYLFPPLIIGSLLPRFYGKSPEKSRFAAKSVFFLSGLAFCAVFAAEAIISAYPARAARNSADYGSFSRALERFPRDRAFREIRCARFRELGNDNGFYECLSGCGREFKDKAKEYFLLAVKSGKPADIPLPAEEKMDCLIIRMLRELELGDQAEAGASFEQAYYLYEAGQNLLRGEPYGADREIAGLIKLNSDGFWTKYVYPALLLWPPEGEARILAGIKKRAALTPPLSSLDRELALMPEHGEFGARLAREKIFSDMVLNVLGLPDRLLRLIMEEDAKRSRALSNLAADKMSAGDLPGAEKLLREALDIHVSNPEALMDLCALAIRKNKKTKALDACRSASYAVYSVPENRLPGFEMLASEADFESYKLLNSLGRKPEAALVLRDCVKRASPSWPGFSAAAKELGR
ncbi:MAG: hypothetical protein NTX59_08155 [Elusimicrobia bacterium]|nr:hypothetical protein [Elusimicrobiota bacterium]